MNAKTYDQQWCCKRCGTDGSAQLDEDMSEYVKNRVLVGSHSLVAPCDGFAEDNMVLRPPGCSVTQWEEIKAHAREKAAKVDRTKDVLDGLPLIPWEGQ